MAITHLRAVLAAPIRPAGKKLVLVALAERSNREGVSWPSREKLGTDTNLSPRMLGIYIPALEREGWLRVERRRSAPTRYYLNLTELSKYNLSPEGDESEPKPRQRRQAKEEDDEYAAYDL